MPTPATTIIDHPAGYAPNPTIIKGEGRPLVYLHGLFGVEWGSFHDKLAQHRKVYAPAHAGSYDFADLDTLDTLWDLILYYDDLFTALGLEEFDLVGHSFGGMVAAEIAAAHINRIGKLVLIDPLGLWKDEEPVADHLLAMPPAQLAMRFGRTDSADVKQLLTPPTDTEENVTAQVHDYMVLGSTAHFVHPIPERGLHRRLRRINVPTLILWGENDRLVPPSYAEAFKAGIAGSSASLISDAGHTPHAEQADATYEAVRAFLG